VIFSAEKKRKNYRKKPIIARTKCHAGLLRNPAIRGTAHVAFCPDMREHIPTSPYGGVDIKKSP
jgi:hypothetical protein